MIFQNFTYEQAIEKSEHFLALGENIIYLDGEPKWDQISRVEAGNSWRLGRPNDLYLIAETSDGLTLKWNFDLEPRSANGSGISQFDRKLLEQIILRLNTSALISLGKLLKDKILPSVQSATEEIEQALQKQKDSENCISNLIKYIEINTSL